MGLKPNTAFPNEAMAGLKNRIYKSLSIWLNKTRETSLFIKLNQAFKVRKVLLSGEIYSGGETRWF